MTRKELFIVTSVGLPIVIFIGMLTVFLPSYELDRDRQEMISLCNNAVSTLTGDRLRLDEASFFNESSNSKLAISRFRVVDEELGFQCQVDRARVGTTITRLVINGEDVTKEYRLKEQN